MSSAREVQEWLLTGPEIRTEADALLEKRVARMRLDVQYRTLRCPRCKVDINARGDGRDSG